MNTWRGREEVVKLRMKKLDIHFPLFGYEEMGLGKAISNLFDLIQIILYGFLLVLFIHFVAIHGVDGDTPKN